MAACCLIGGAAEDEALAVGRRENGEACAPDQRPRQVAEDDEGHQRHDQALVTERHDGSWNHPTCTFSFARAAQMLLGPDWNAPPKQKRADPPHTPWRDAQDIVDAHFRVLDRIAAARCSERT